MNLLIALSIVILVVGFTTVIAFYFIRKAKKASF
jgi:hypothetical protein